MRTALCLSLAGVAAVLLAGCIDANLVQCGDNVCPAAGLCRSGRCVTQTQLDACAGSADGDACTLMFNDGVCFDGACSVAICGDGVLDATEACDDGNRSDRDGCRSDCRSTEVCGNGLLDSGERCDCGSDDATRPEGCEMTNSADPAALCDPACSRHCGDAMVTGAETCDGTNVPVDCVDFGFYDGDVSCSPFCTFDRSACSGRCGDGMLQSNHGEQCDGSLPANVSCFTYGADFGHLSCGEFCTAEVAQDCHRFGWETVFAGVSTAGYLQAAGLNDHGVMARNFDLVHVTYDGVTVERNDLTTPTRILATDDAFVVFAGSKAHRYNASGWTDFTAPPFTSVVADGDYLYTLNGCVVERIHVATWATSTLPASGLTQCNGLDVLNGSILVGGVDRIAAYTGTWRVRTGLAGNLNGVGWRDASHAYASQGSTTLSIVDLDSSDPPVVITSSHTGFVTNGQGDMIDVLSGTASVTVGLLRAPLPGSNQQHGYGRAADGGFFRFERSVQRLRPFYMTADARSDWYAFTPQPDGAVATCDQSSVSSFGVGATVSRGYASSSMGECFATLGPITDVHYIATSTNEIYRFDTVDYVLEETLTASISTLLADGDGTPWVMSSNDILMREPASGKWSTTSPPAGCTWIDLAANSKDVYALGTCNSQSVLYRRTGSTWEVAATTALNLTDLTTATEDGAVFAAGSWLVRLDGTAWTLLDDSDDWQHVAARSANDAFVLSASGFVLTHWNGTDVSPINVPGKIFTVLNSAIRMGPRGLVMSGFAGIQQIPNWEPIDGI